MGLLRYYLRHELATLHKNNVRIRVIGDRSLLDPDIAQMISDAEKKTADNTSITLILALSYGGRQEIVAATRALAVKVAAGEMKADAVDEAAIAAHLYAPDVPAFSSAFLCMDPCHIF